jgi:Domain of unknown function (DUF4833)
MPAQTLDLFTIAKSENRNQVQYAVRVDGQCAPLDAAPIVTYWRMLERGPTQTEPLLPREQPAYGIGTQAVTTRRVDGGRVHLVLRATPSRPIDVDLWQDSDGACHASAVTTIAGAPARLFNVYAKLKWPFGVEYLLLQGWSMDSARVAREKMQ